MQKLFIAITFALAFSSALADYSTNNYVKPPVSVASDNDTNYTSKYDLFLASLTVGDLYLVSADVAASPSNVSANNWTLWYRKLDAKALSYSADNTATFVAPLLVFYYNNYAFSLDGDETGTPQIRVYQSPLNGGAVLPRFTITSNNNASFTPSVAQLAMIGKNLYLFYVAASQKINVTSFAVGGSASSLEFTLTRSYTSDSLRVVWGESLSSSQLFASWVENGVLKDAVVDVSNGKFTPNTIGDYDKSYACSAYATDKKWYGDLCTAENSTTGTINYYIRYNTTNLTLLANYPLNTSGLKSTYPYGQYLAIVYVDSSNSSLSYNYEIWNIDTLTMFKNRTQFLTIDSKSEVTFYRVPSGGLYTLTYNQQNDNPRSSIKVGLLLSGSSLTSVLGSLLAIIAGLLLF